jgi:integrase
MSDSDFTPSVRPDKPAKPNKPRPDFPLFAHAAGVWAKKIRGKLHYFGPWSDPDGALNNYNLQKEALHAGRKPREDPEAVTVKDAANAFLRHKMALRDGGELSPRTWDEYKEVCDLIVAAFGKSRLVDDLGSDDFAALRKKLAKRWGPMRLGNVIQRIRSVFKHALDAGLIDRPVRFGPGFQRPSAKVLRLQRAKQGAKLFTAEEVRRLIDAAPAQLRTMVLLGVNCGYGIADCGRLLLSAVDLQAGWIDFPRPKTGIARRCPLWPETSAALVEWLGMRVEPKDAACKELVFLTAQGRPWHKENMSGPLPFKFNKLLHSLGINGRKGLGFYTLRHVHRTIADEAKDQPAADYIMGHARGDMASVYRERIDDSRLRAVVDHVRGWLFPSAATITSVE